VVYPVTHLSQVVEFLSKRMEISPQHVDVKTIFSQNSIYAFDYQDVIGQDHAKRALEIAAAGGHNVLMIGPPGSGKTMLARRLPTILPPLSFEEALETTAVYSVSGILTGEPLLTTRPFCAPHHSISDAGLIGGGAMPRPGQVSLAHNGVLFLDELPEFKKNVLESLRQPMEDGHVTISRANLSLTFPARFSLICAQNPCPCGHFGDTLHPCTCPPRQIALYRSRISGPLLDRIDIQIEVPAVPYKELGKGAQGEKSDSIRERVISARNIQAQRFMNIPVHCNAQMSSREIRKMCRLSAGCANLLEIVSKKLGLSARAYHRIIKIARTIADIEGVPDILESHIAEAIQYRSLDRNRPV
jgi:magnesium chelatase family protein